MYTYSMWMCFLLCNDLLVTVRASVCVCAGWFVISFRGKWMGRDRGHKVLTDGHQLVENSDT